MLKLGLAYVSKTPMYELLHKLEEFVDPTELDFKDAWDFIAQLVDTQLGTPDREHIHQDLSAFKMYLRDELKNVVGLEHGTILSELIEVLINTACMVHAQIPANAISVKFISEGEEHLLFHMTVE